VEINGAQHFLINNIDKPVAVDAAPVDTEHATLLSHFDQSYSNDARRINEVFAAKLAASKKMWNSRIYSANNESAANEVAQKAKRRKVSGLISQRDADIGAIESAKADELSKALAAFNDRKRQEEQRRDRAVARIDSTNVAASQAYADDVTDAGSYAWLISIALLGLIAGLGYARVRINVKSGILPLRNYTVLDAHGSAAERIGTAIGDAFNRQSMKAAVAIHKALSPSGAITSFDGTVIAKQGTYNTPAGFHQVQPPTPSHKVDAGEAWAKVFAKMQEMQQGQPGYVPAPHILKKEHSMAMEMNGTYQAAPWSDPDLPGKS
jgi:hypothetical protein